MYMDFDFSIIINKLSEIHKNMSYYLYDEHPILGLVANIITIGTPILLFIKRLKSRLWKKKEIDMLGEIDDNYTLNLVKSHKYIQTMGQKESPHEDETVYISPNRFPLAKHIRNDILNKDEHSCIKRYMILGGSGMGKSTFSVALYYYFIYKYKLHRHYSIYIKSLSDPEIINILNNLNFSLKRNSIIILDALDENIEAAQDTSAFIDKLEKATSKFNVVIITCRTQFFYDEDSEPNELKIKKKWGQIRKLRYDKIFISPFTQKEAKKYLGRRYGLNIWKYYKAVKISKKCWDVLSRPMILSFIDDLVELEKIKDLTAVEIYSKIIDKWFDHENQIQDVDKSDLYSFSKKISLLMYNKWKESKFPIISEQEYNQFVKENGFEKSPYSFRARSLINRRSDGAIKFSHRSIWEFFMAMYAYKNPGRSLIGNTLTMAIRFINEFYSLGLNIVRINNLEYNDITKRISFIHSSHSDAKLFKTTETDSGRIILQEGVQPYIDFYYDSWEIILNAYFYKIRTKPASIESPAVLSVLKLRYPELKNWIDALLNYYIKFLYLLQFGFIDYPVYYGSYVDKEIFILNKNLLERQNYLHERYAKKLLSNNVEDKSSIQYDNEHLDSSMFRIIFPKTNEHTIPDCSFIVIGCSFSSNEDIINYVGKIKNLRFIIIIKESEDFNEIVSFIDDFKRCDIIDQKIVIDISYYGYTVDYYIDRETNRHPKNDIKKILHNMLLARSSKNHKTMFRG